MKPTASIAAILLVVQLQSKVCRGDAIEKHWLASAEWLAPSNWLEGQLPQSDSRVVFPLAQHHAAGLPRTLGKQLRLSGLELPQDGIVALPENGQVSLSDRGSGQGKTSRWARETPYFWVDPLNWDVVSEAVPHLERLPCQGDVVVLPASSRTFSVRLPETRDIEVRRVRLADDNRTLTRWEWKAMAGRAEFRASRFSVTYSPLTACENCRCQEGDLSEYWEEVCNVVRPRCGLPECEYPLKVEGHCCYYCGGRIRLSKKILLSTTQRIGKKVLKSYEASLHWHSRVTWDGYSEILITEKQRYAGTDTIIAVADLEAALKEEGAEVLLAESSGEPLYDHRLAVALGPLLGVSLLLVLLILLLCPLFGYTYSQIWEACRELGAAMCIVERRINGIKRKSFAFARFENIFEGNVQIAEEVDPNVQTTSSGERFENPLYSSRRHSKSGMAQKKSLDPSKPVSLMALEKAIEHNHTEDIEMDIENF